MKFHFDQLERIDHAEHRSDATGLNFFFSNQLEGIRKELYTKRYPELKARRLVPITNDIHPGQMSLTERAVDEVGEADFVGDLADDIQSVEVVKSQEDTYYMRMIALKYGWSLQELRNAQFAQSDLDSRKAGACRRAIERFIDKNLLIGHASALGRSLQGLFTLSGAQAPLAFAGDLVGTFDDQSSEDLFRNLMQFASYSYDQTKELETVDTIVMPSTLKSVLMNRRMGDANNSTILAYFLASQEYIKNVETSYYLEKSAGHGGGANARLVAYRNDKEVLEGLVNEFEQLPTEWKGMRSETICLARVGGVKVRLPMGIAYWDVARP